MREYIPSEKNKYWLPHNVYYIALYTVRDYDRLCGEYQDILYSSAPSADGQPRGTRMGAPTEQKAERIAEVSEKLDAIERALNQLPEEYRQPVFNNVRYNRPYPYTAGVSTWSRWRRRFLFYVAKYLHLW